MSNRPIPRKGLLGCWFLDDRGIAYNSGTNEAKDRSGRGNHATYKNGVTVGVEGDPAREFGASDFDASSNQFARVNDPLAVDGPQAVVGIVKPNSLDTQSSYFFSNGGFSSTGIDFGLDTVGQSLIRFPDGNGGTQSAVSDTVQANTFSSQVGFYDGSRVGLYIDGELKDTELLSSIGVGQTNAVIGADAAPDLFWDGEIAAVARYDLTVPDAPEPSEIARKWDKLRDIPATR